VSKEDPEWTEVTVETPEENLSWRYYHAHARCVRAAIHPAAEQPVISEP
jgi:hypothetical protein